jgi:transposase
LINQKTKLAEAIRYTLSRWHGLSRFVDAGPIEIDSNVVEGAIRPIALNRKNALFAGSWRRTLGRHRFARRDMQAQRHQSARMLRGNHCKDRHGHPNSQIDGLLP